MIRFFFFHLKGERWSFGGCPGTLAQLDLLPAQTVPVCGSVDADERARHFWFSEQDAAPLWSIVSLLEGSV